MAVAEARAVWQRTANRCFVQEDAKRAPKLACCQSSSSSSKQVDGAPVNEAGLPDDPAAGFMPYHRNSPYSSLPSDTRWWLQLQPNYGYQKVPTHEQLNALESEIENMRAEIVNSAIKSGEVHDHNKNVDHGISNDGVKNTVASKQEAEVLCDENSTGFTNLKNTREDLKLMDMEAIEYLPWIASEKNGPWWRTTDRDDLASLVAQKSLDYIENCDLPPPQKVHVKRYSGGHSGSFEYDVVFSSIIEQSDLTPEKQSGSYCQSGSDQPISNDTSHESTSSIGQVPDDVTSKAELLEALRHSQTRAREAEEVAKRASKDKEHIVKLFFRQASQLFAYKQWFQLLQLENLYYQLKNGEQPVSNLFPVGPKRGRKYFQKSTRTKRGRHGKPSDEISKYAVAFALGLSLVGAGLLLGWTVGWMLPL